MSRPDPLPDLSSFPFQTFEKLRYSDTDQLGHVNNAIFSTMLETGRVDCLVGVQPPLYDPGCGLVIVNMNLDYLAEIGWPGEVQVGSRIVRVGGSSMTMEQALFQNGRCAAFATNVLVQMNQTSRSAQPFSPELRARLTALIHQDGAA